MRCSARSLDLSPPDGPRRAVRHGERREYVAGVAVGTSAAGGTTAPRPCAVARQRAATESVPPWKGCTRRLPDVRCSPVG
ncbi:hypothetical protein GCM10009756_33270 [Pseudokineococcus marinus]